MVAKTRTHDVHVEVTETAVIIVPVTIGIRVAVGLVGYFGANTRPSIVTVTARPGAVGLVITLSLVVVVEIAAGLGVITTVVGAASFPVAA